MSLTRSLPGRRSPSFVQVGGGWLNPVSLRKARRGSERVHRWPNGMKSVGETCRQGRIRDLKPMSAQARELRRREAPQGGRERRFPLDILATQVVSRRSREPRCRVDPLDCVSHPEVRPGVAFAPEFRNDSPRPKSPNLIRRDVDQPEGAMPPLDHALERAWIDAQRCRGVAHQKKVKSFAETATGLEQRLDSQVVVDATVPEFISLRGRRRRCAIQ